MREPYTDSNLTDGEIALRIVPSVLRAFSRRFRNLRWISDNKTCRSSRVETHYPTSVVVQAPLLSSHNVVPFLSWISFHSLTPCGLLSITQQPWRGRKNNIIARAISKSFHPSETFCLMDCFAGEEVRLSPNEECVHVFHKDCMLDWILRKRRCPKCRRDYVSVSFSLSVKCCGICLMGLSNRG